MTPYSDVVGYQFFWGLCGILPHHYNVMARV